MAYSFPLTMPFAPTGSVTQAALDLKYTQALNDLYALLGVALSDTGWQTITLASGFVKSGTLDPGYRVFGGVVYFRGYVAPTSGSFAANSSIIIAAAGAIPADVVPSTQAAAEKQIPGNTAATSVRAFVSPNGSMSIVTGATGPLNVGISGLSGYIAGS